MRQNVKHQHDRIKLNLLPTMSFPARIKKKVNKSKLVRSNNNEIHPEYNVSPIKPKNVMASKDVLYHSMLNLPSASLSNKKSTSTPRLFKNLKRSQESNPFKFSPRRSTMLTMGVNHRDELTRHI